MVKYQLLSDKDVILFEGESDEPFEELHKYKRKTFSDVHDRQFRSSDLRSYLKNLMNCGGEIKIKIIK